VEQKRAQKQALLPPFCSGLLFHRQPLQFSEHYSSSSSPDLFAVGIDCLSVRRHFMVSIYKNSPPLCGTTGAIIWPESRSAILQSLQADCPAPQSLFWLTSTAMPSSTDSR
jgi:hypothetical protein